MPENALICIKNDIYVTDIPDQVRNMLAEKFSMPNPLYKNNKEKGYSTRGIPKVLRFYEFEKTDSSSITLPRGGLDTVREILEEEDIPYEISNDNPEFEPVPFKFSGNLRPVQHRALDDMLRHDMGTLCAPTGSGKTLMALALVAKRMQSALVIVHTKTLLQQWIERINGFLMAAGGIVPYDVVRVNTDFWVDTDPVEFYAHVLQEICIDRSRNSLIARYAVQEAKAGETCLILSDRREHCRVLCDMLVGKGIKAAVLTGDLPPDTRKEIIGRLDNGEIEALCGTVQLIGEGFDSKGLTAIFLATPIKFEGRLIQSIGRVMRPSPGKGKAKVYDFVDEKIGVFLSAANARDRIYQEHQRQTIEAHRSSGGGVAIASRTVAGNNMAFSGTVMRVIFYNKENGYIVLLASDGRSTTTLVGTYHTFNEHDNPRRGLPGKKIDVEGSWVENKKYGKQFKFDVLISGKASSP
ncbi:MAG: helicase-related protein [Syntrophorhabdaceae bacterium]|nr:helicase-related protein [Syntrophorhabdaceae bacterium]